jgi:hypothetical protein
VLPPSHEDDLNRIRLVTTPDGPAAAPGTSTKEPDMTDTTRRTLESLAKLRLPELQARFAEIVGQPTRSPNKTFLLRKIGEALEARARDAAAASQADSPTTTPAKVRLTKLSVAELQAMYREVVGRETRSSDSAYLVWKLRRAQKGRIRVRPIERRAPGGEAADVKVLPLRMTAAEVEALDEAWRRLGFKSRTAMIRRAIADFLGAGRDA